MCFTVRGEANIKGEYLKFFETLEVVKEKYLKFLETVSRFLFWSAFWNDVIM